MGDGVGSNPRGVGAGVLTTGGSSVGLGVSIGPPGVGLGVISIGEGVVGGGIGFGCGVGGKDCCNVRVQNPTSSSVISISFFLFFFVCLFSITFVVDESTTCFTIP